MADLATLKTRLTEAEAAKHDLAMGARVVEVVRDGRRIRYQEANKGDLDTYIDKLLREIDDLEAPASGSLPRRRFIPAAFR